MTSKRKAEIQRKLTLSAVPRPPEDLLDRIKGDIPKYLNVEAERERFSRSIGFNLRVAASIIVLLSIASLLFMIDNRMEEPVASIAYRAQPKVAAPARAAEQQQLANTTAPAASPTEEVHVDILQAAPALEDGRSRPSSEQAGLPVVHHMQRDDVANEAGDERAESSVRSGVGGVVGGSSADFAPEPQQVAEAELATAPAPVAAPPPAEPVFAARPRASGTETRGVMSKTAAAPTIMPEAYAADLALTPTSVFGISLDPEAFRRIRTTIENGSRPSPSSVDVEALVNYFAGAPARPVKRGVRLETEASPAPVDANGHRGILRFTIDTAMIDVPEHGSVPPIATDARLEIEFNRDAVERIEAIGDTTTLTPESVLLHNTSVTGLFALHLRTPLQEKQRVATVRLQYRSVADGRKHTIVREVRGSDFAKQWPKASRRHRLASLGALWGESLRGSRGGSDVARRAEELATQAPNDQRARELAEVAVASSGGTK